MQHISDWEHVCLEKGSESFLMNITVIVNDKIINNDLSSFFLSNKKINFKCHTMKKKSLYNKHNVIFLFLNTSKKKDIINISNDIQSSDYKNITFFLPVKFKKEFMHSKIHCLFYPITISDFENILLTFYDKKIISFKNLQLFNDNILVRDQDKKRVYLTEIESKILNYLFLKKTINKKTINSKILNQQPTVVSKSLESHLYRLRKKIFALDKKTKIIVKNDQTITIR